MAFVYAAIHAFENTVRDMTVKAGRIGKTFNIYPLYLPTPSS